MGAAVGLPSPWTVWEVGFRHRVWSSVWCPQISDFRRQDRLFWVALSLLWKPWRHALLIVQPDTIIRWHRLGFRLFWRWKSRRGKTGRPETDGEIRALIERFARENPTWGAPRIHSELRLLGIRVAQSTVSRHLRKLRPPDGATRARWRIFLKEHAKEIAACDLFTVPTVLFGLLYGFVVLSLDRRRIVHIAVTRHPTAAWLSQQMREAYPGFAPEKQAENPQHLFELSASSHLQPTVPSPQPAFLLRDRDSVYGQTFRDAVKGIGPREVLTSYHCPWQNGYCERLIGSIRRECLDHVLVLNEGHLRRLMRDYADYYNTQRPHLSLKKNAPEPRALDPPQNGARIVAVPHVAGLHHHYYRQAA